MGLGNDPGHSSWAHFICCLCLCINETKGGAELFSLFWSWATCHLPARTNIINEHGWLWGDGGARTLVHYGSHLGEYDGSWRNMKSSCLFTMKTSKVSVLVCFLQIVKATALSNWTEASLQKPFSQQVCLLCVSVSNFGHSAIFQLFQIIIIFVMVIFNVALGCSYKTSNSKELFKLIN